MKGSSLSSRAGSLVCPPCEVHNLEARDQSSAHCDSCGGLVSGAMLESLRRVTGLPEALVRHVCECGHPEMRLLPDGTHHCRACGSEVLPLSALPIDWRSCDRGEVYFVGWLDSCVAGSDSFVDYPNMPWWEDSSERLIFCRGHRADHEACQTRITDKTGLIRGESQLLEFGRKVEAS